MAYQSDETGRYEIYVQGFPELRGKWQISTAGGWFPRWGRDGREIFYLSPDNKLMSVSLTLTPDAVELRAPKELFAFPPLGLAQYRSPYDVTPDGQRVLVAASPQKGQPLTLIVNWPAALSSGR